MRRFIFTALLLTAVLSPPLAAQRATPPAFPHFSPQLQNDARAGAPAAYPPPFGDPKDYRYEGAIAGAVVFGGGFYVLTQIGCESDCDSTGLKGAALGVVVGGLFGLLIGGMMTKQGP